MDVDKKVVALPGYSVPVPHGQPVADVVEILEEYLDKAKAGLVIAVAVAVVMKPDVSGELIASSFMASRGNAWNLEASIAKMVRRFSRAIDGHDAVSTR